MRASNTLRLYSAFLILGAAAVAAHPNPVTGSWDVYENSAAKTGILTLSQGSETSPCRFVTGTLTPTGKAATQVRGAYCPDSGRLWFVRENAQGAFQAWFVQSTGAHGCDTYFGGTAARLVGKTGTLGDLAVVLHRPDRCDD